MTYGTEGKQSYQGDQPRIGTDQAPAFVDIDRRLENSNNRRNELINIVEAKLTTISFPPTKDKKTQEPEGNAKPDCFQNALNRHIRIMDDHNDRLQQIVAHLTSIVGD